jgi:hypothetical protein
LITLSLKSLLYALAISDNKLILIGVTQLDLDLVDFVQLATRITEIQFAVIIELRNSTA